MNCKEINQKISQFIDGELDVCECEAIKTHIENCHLCKNFYKSFTRNIELCKELLKVDVSAEIKDRLRLRLQEEYKKCLE